MIKAAQNLAGYFARHAERPSFKASTPPPPPAASCGSAAQFGRIACRALNSPPAKSVISRQSHAKRLESLGIPGRRPARWPRIGAAAAGRESTRGGRLVSI